MDRRNQRLKLSLFAFMVTCVSWAIACSSAAQAPAPAASPTTEQQPQYGGTMRLFGLSIPVNLDIIGSPQTSVNRATGGIYERLVTLDYPDPKYRVTNAVIPGLAERWEMSPDGKSYTFFLRKGVKFHDGVEFTSADVLFSYNRIIDEKTPSIIQLRDVVSIQAPDPYTVKIATKVASVDFLGGLEGNLGIQPKHLGDQGVDFKKVAIGTGPFKLKSHDAKTQTVWVKNENYWQQGLPYLDQVEVIWPLDKSAMLAAFASGNIDDTGLTNTLDYQTLRKSVPNLKFNKGSFGSAISMYINVEHPVLRDVRVRRAINLAVDRQDLAKLIADGDLYLDCVFPSILELCPPDFAQRPGFRQPKDPDIAEAKRLLAEAGYPNGFEFKFLYSQQLTQSVPKVEPFTTYMSRIGIKAIPDGRDTATYNAVRLQGTYDMVLNSGPVNTQPSVGLYSQYHSKGQYNKHGIGSPALDQLIEQESQTFNVEERKKILQQIGQIILDNAWMISFVDAPQYVMAQPWVNGPSLLHIIGSSGFQPAPIAATTWFDQKLAPKR